MDIRIDTNRYSVGAPLPAVHFAPGVIAGQANCASEVSFQSAPISNSGFGQYPHPSSQASQQGLSCANFSQPPGNFTNFYSSAQPSPSTFSHQQSTPKKNRNYDTTNYQRGYDQNFQQRFNNGPPQQAPMPPFTNANNSNLTQPPFRRCNSMGVSSNNSSNNFRMNAPQPPPISNFGQQDAYPPGHQQQLPHREIGRSRNLSQSTHHKRYVSGGGVVKSKKKYDRKNDQNNSSYRNKLSKDKRSPGFYDSSSMQRPAKRKWNRNSNEKSKRFCDRSKKFSKWTECSSRDVARVHRNCVENGQPLAPYNTTQFIMNEHMAEKEFDFDESSGQIQHHRRLSEGSDFDETEEYSSPAEEDEDQYLDKLFNEAFQNVHRETLIKKSKDELVTDILLLEKKYTSLSKSYRSRTIKKNRLKLKHIQSRRLLQEIYMRHNLLAHSYQNLASSTGCPQISSTSASSDNEISPQRVKLEEYILPENLDYMIQYCLQDSDDDDDDDDDTSTSSSSSDCDSEYSSSSDSSYGSDCSSDVELEVSSTLNDLLDLIELNFQ